MLRLPRLWLALGFGIVLCFQLSCSREKTGEPAPTPTDVRFDPNVSAATIEGFLYRESGAGVRGGALFLLSDPAQAPSGSEPAAGVSMDVLNPRDESVASSQTSPDGSFFVSSLPTGPLSLRVAGDGGDLVRRFSGIPGTRLDLGFEPVISFEDAAQRVRDSALGARFSYDPSDLVLGTLQPLPTGTIVYPSVWALSDATVPAEEVIRITAPTWFFYVDPGFGERFGHAVVETRASGLPLLLPWVPNAPRSG